MPNRIAHPQGTETRIVRAAVRKNLMADGVVFEKHDDFAGRLNDLHREWMENNPREAGWSTDVVNGIVRFRDGKRMSSEGGLGSFILRLAPHSHGRLILV